MNVSKLSYVLGLSALLFCLSAAPALAEETVPDGDPDRQELVDFLSQGSNQSAGDAKQEIDDLNTALDELNADDPDAEAALIDRADGRAALAEAEAELAAAQEKLDNATPGSDEEAAALLDILDANAKIENAKTQIDEAEQVLVDSNPENGDLLEALTDAETKLASAEGDLAGIQAVVEQMSDQQVGWTNQKFQNAKSSGLVVDIPLEDLEKFTEYNFHQISAATKAYEAEAMFVSKAERFDEGSKQFEMFNEKAETQKEKFLGKVGRFESEAGEASELATDEAKNSAKQEGKDVTKQAAKQQAKNSAKQHAKSSAKALAKASAKDAAKDAAKQAAKDNAKNAAKQVVKEEGKSAGKGLAKGKSKENAKENAKDNNTS